MEDLKVTSLAIDKWGRRIILEDLFDPHILNIKSKNDFCSDYLLCRKLAEVHPNIYALKVLKTNFNTRMYDISDDDSKLFADEWFEDWDILNKELQKQLLLPRKVEFKKGYDIPKNCMPYEHDLDKYKRHEDIAVSKTVDSDFNLHIPTYSLNTHPTSLHVQWSKVNEIKLSD